MKCAAFFRNVNLGRANNPTKVQLESAFVAAGASSAVSFLTNGNVVFTVGTEAQARKVVASACETLKTQYGLKEPAYVRSIGDLAKLVASDPFVSIEREKVYQCCISFLHSKLISRPKAPLESTRRDIKVLRIKSGEAFSVTRKVGGTPGNATAFLEKLLKVPVTTRNWNTVVRIVEKHA